MTAHRAQPATRSVGHRREPEQAPAAAGAPTYVRRSSYRRGSLVRVPDDRLRDERQPMAGLRGPCSAHSRSSANARGAETDAAPDRHPDAGADVVERAGQVALGWACSAASSAGVSGPTVRGAARGADPRATGSARSPGWRPRAAAGAPTSRPATRPRPAARRAPSSQRARAGNASCTISTANSVSTDCKRQVARVAVIELAGRNASGSATPCAAQQRRACRRSIPNRRRPRLVETRPSCAAIASSSRGEVPRRH